MPEQISKSSKNQGIRDILITSTSETYGTAQKVPIDELHPLVGQSPYSASKIAADQLAISYNKSFDMPIKIVRPFNTYGPRQSARAIIPTIISQILKGHSTLSIENPIHRQSEKDCICFRTRCIRTYYTLFHN